MLNVSHLVSILIYNPKYYMNDSLIWYYKPILYEGHACVSNAII